MTILFRLSIGTPSSPSLTEYEYHDDGTVHITARSAVTITVGDLEFALLQIRTFIAGAQSFGAPPRTLTDDQHTSRIVDDAGQAGKVTMRFRDGAFIADASSDLSVDAIAFADRADTTMEWSAFIRFYLWLDGMARSIRA